MRPRNRHPLFNLLPALALSTGLAACDDNGEMITDPNGDDPAATSAVEGSVENTHSSPNSSALPAPHSSTGSGTTPETTAGAEAATAAVAQVQSDGSLEFLAEAEVEADGTFRVEDVPANRSDLVVVLRAEDEAEVGRVLVHGETEAGVTLVTEPVNANTTVAGHVYGNLVDAGVAQEVRSTAHLALLLRMEESTAAEVAASAQAIQEVATGIQAGIESKMETLVATESEVDPDAWAALMLQAAQTHAESRHGGADARAAQEAFLEAGLSALFEAGADAEKSALATTSAATGLDRAMAEADSQARLDLAKHFVEFNFLARQELAQEHPEEASRDEGASALAEARVEAEAATSISQLAQAVEGSGEVFLDGVVDLAISVLPDLGGDARAQLESSLETALANAWFGAHVGAAATPSELAQAVVEYRSQVRSTVDAFVESAPAEADAEGYVSAELLIAVRGGPALGDS